MSDVLSILREPQRHPLGGAAYHPELRLVRQRSQQSVTDEAGGNHLRMFELYTSNIHHEFFHWLQWQGTTFGAFLQLLKRIRHYATEIDLAINIPRDALQAVLLRRRESKSPIIPITRDFMLDVDELHPQLRALAETYYYFLAAECMLLRMSAVRSLSAPPPEVINKVLGMVQFAASQGKKAASNYDITAINPAGVDDVPLDTSMLMETAASVLELRHLRQARRHSKDPAEHSGELATAWGEDEEALWDVREVFRSRDDYALALIAAARYIGNDLVVESSRWMPSLLLVIHEALNPPLPPIAEPPSHGLQWSDIYPPLRYFRLLEAVQELGPFEGGMESPPEEVISYLDAIRNAASLPKLSFHRSNYLHGIYDVESAEGDHKEAVEYIASFPFRFWERPAARILPAWGKTPAIEREMGLYAMGACKESWLPELLLPAYSINEKGVFGFPRRFPRNRSDNVFYVIASDASVDDLMLRTGRLTLLDDCGIRGDVRDATVELIGEHFTDVLGASPW